MPPLKKRAMVVLMPRLSGCVPSRGFPEVVSEQPFYQKILLGTLSRKPASAGAARSTGIDARAVGSGVQAEDFLNRFLDIGLHSERVSYCAL